MPFISGVLRKINSDTKKKICFTEEMNSDSSIESAKFLREVSKKLLLKLSRLTSPFSTSTRESVAFAVGELAKEIKNESKKTEAMMIKVGM